MFSSNGNHPSTRRIMEGKMDIKRILVPVDFSDFSSKALNYASRWAEHFDARMTLMHAVVLHSEEFDEEEKLRKLEVYAEEKEKERFVMLNEHKDLLENPEEMIDNRVRPDHIGLLSMKDRAELIGACLKIDSHYDEGTSISFTFCPASPR